MADYGHDLLFGAFLSPAADTVERTVTQARLAESLGLELIGIQDHLYHPGFLDALTLLTHLAARTETVTLFPDVAGLPLRGPVTLANFAASLSVLSGGRAALGLGSGAHPAGIASLGGPRRSPGEQVAALDEGVEVIRRLLGRDPGPTFDGRHYRLAGAAPALERPLPGEIPLWLGGYGPRSLRLIGRKADGWIPSSAYLPPWRLPAANAVIDEAARDAGRDPAEIRRLYNVDGAFRASGGGGFLDGPPELWAAQLTELALRDGVSAFVLAPGARPEEEIKIFAGDVAPAVREGVARARATA
ncbi:MAG TPA: LLM class flavin-dependent oxidoreductase [Thermomonospora sp.]|nr:LLM class flavin-dependent oxidoreductase [Thermomonospora sp.]